MPTAHNDAKKGDIAKTVLMPGDPRRAKFIAETYFENPVQFNNVRGMMGFTGTYKGKPVSAMGSGMGMPSIGIYSYELFTQYDVDSIIRVGTAGGYADNLKLFDVLLVTEAYSKSSFARCQNGFEGDVIAGGPALLSRLQDSARRLAVPVIEGRIHSSDVFYYQPVPGALPGWQALWQQHQCLAVEMESFALFHNANVTGKQAACLLTVSDLLASHQETTAEEREKSFTQMMEVALGVL